MALHLNLLHEEISEQRQRQRDPLKIGMMVIGALDANAARVMMQEGDAGMAEICRSSLTRLATEVRNSIGFYEGQHEQGIHRIFVSGGLAKTETIL